MGNFTPNNIIPDLVVHFTGFFWTAQLSSSRCECLFLCRRFGALLAERRIDATIQHALYSGNGGEIGFGIVCGSGGTGGGGGSYRRGESFEPTSLATGASSFRAICGTAGFYLFCDSENHR